MYRLVGLVLFFASSARASDAWIECYVGRGGLDSAEEVYRQALQAVARDDVAALVALAPDRCGVFRSVKLHGSSAFEHFAQLESQRPDALAALRALVAIEGASVETLMEPVADDAAEDEEWPKATIMTTAEPDRQRVIVRVTTMAIDGRWYLWRPPGVERVRESVFMREYQRLAERLIRQSRSHTTEAALLAVIANWYKAEAKSVVQVQRALTALPTHLAVEAAKVSARIGLELGEPGVTDDAVMTSLAPMFQTAVRPTGLAACDDFLSALVDCVTTEEYSLDLLHSMATGLAVRHQEGDGEVEEECRGLGTALRDEGCSGVMP